MNNQRISELLVETGGFRDLNYPVILTSGELGIYFVNAEKLCQDGGEFEIYGDDASMMIMHAKRMMEQHPTFREVIDIITNYIKNLVNSVDGDFAISGGQRRDWPFSGPVAHSLRLPHVALYKQVAGQEDLVEMVFHNGDVETVDNLSGLKVIHVADLITEGSSVYREEGSMQKGWAPMTHEKGACIGDLIAVVSRRQGGEEMLYRQGIMAHAFVTIDEDFLRKHSQNPERALAYLEDPSGWSRDYLMREGALSLVDAFNPTCGKIDRARRFLERYGKVLKETGRLDELDRAVSAKFGKTLDGLIEGD